MTVDHNDLKRHGLAGTKTHLRSLFLLASDICAGDNSIFHITHGDVAVSNKRSTKPAEPKYTEEDRKRSHEKFMIVANAISGLAKLGVCLFFASQIVYWGIYRTITESAGTNTTISYLVSWIVDASIHVWAAWSVAAACGTWACLERRKRLSERREKDERISELEKRLDPIRTSSEATIGGE